MLGREIRSRPNSARGAAKPYASTQTNRRPGSAREPTTKADLLGDARYDPTTTGMHQASKSTSKLRPGSAFMRRPAWNNDVKTWGSILNSTTPTQPLSVRPAKQPPCGAASVKRAFSIFSFPLDSIGTQRPLAVCPIVRPHSGRRITVSKVDSNVVKLCRTTAMHEV